MMSDKKVEEPMQEEVFQCNLQEKWLALMLSGEKSIEGRLHRDKWTTLKVGQKVCINKKHFFILKEILRYATFKELIESQGSKVFPNMSLEAGLKVYFEEIKFSREDEKTYGVVGLRLEKVK